MGKRKNSPLQFGGLMAFLAGFVIFMGIITGEIYYPEGYNTAVNDISDLGSTRPPDSIIHQPSATIFNTTMLVAGLLLCASNWPVYRHFRKLWFTIPYALFAIGVFGVGVFPGNIAPYHGIFSLLTFVMGSFTCILGFTILKRPFAVIGIPIGIMSLIFLFGAPYFIPFWGSGGTERWVAYPIVIWLIGFGGYLMSKTKK
ncbi:MAG: DUF998 domain-containing protein [Maribacter sp.]|uniref:DUF998 domain-containing protein n=1 Tax=Maribacter sp. TaxID=1897614 RepID=UPI003C759B6D